MKNLGSKIVAATPIIVGLLATAGYACYSLGHSVGRLTPVSEEDATRVLVYALKAFTAELKPCVEPGRYPDTNILYGALGATWTTPTPTPSNHFIFDDMATTSTTTDITDETTVALTTTLSGTTFLEPVETPTPGPVVTGIYTPTPLPNILCFDDDPEPEPIITMEGDISGKPTKVIVNCPCNACHHKPSIEITP